jgi:hypothetical protein
VKSAPLREISEAVGDAWTAGTRTVNDLREAATDRASDLTSAADRLVPSRRARRAKQTRIRGFAFVGGAVLLVCAIVALRMFRARQNKVADDASSLTPTRDEERRRAVAGS